MKQNFMAIWIIISRTRATRKDRDDIKLVVNIERDRFGETVQVADH